MATDRTLLTVVLACSAATLFHHSHNAEFLAEYPNLPTSLTRGGVYLAWLGATIVGFAGYALLRRGWRRIGTGLLVAYGCYCLDGLIHYALAPVAEHGAMMNISIGMEAATGAALLAVVLGLVPTQPRR